MKAGASFRPPWSVVWALSVTQIISWGSVYYAISVLITPIEQALGWSRDAIVGAFSLSLLCAGLGAFPVGVLIDRYGGRAVMAGGSLAAGLLFILLSQVQSIHAFYLIWVGLGFTMATVLYEPAFAVITASFHEQARKGITALTLAGGFASTVFWPLTQVLVTEFGWRHALVGLALFNLVVCAPVHAFFLPAPARKKTSPHRAGDDKDEAQGPKPGARSLASIVGSRAFCMLAIAFTANMLAFSSLSVHLIPLLVEKGFSASDAVWLAALIGPMQVAGRIAEYTVGARFRATQVALIALTLLPLALTALVFTKAPGWLPVIAFVVLYGASNGIMTIARGMIPAEIFGRDRYGAVNGALSAPVLASRAAGPIVASVVWSTAGGYDAVLWTLAACGLVSVAAFKLR